MIQTSQLSKFHTHRYKSTIWGDLAVKPNLVVALSIICQTQFMMSSWKNEFYGGSNCRDLICENDIWQLVWHCIQPFIKQLDKRFNCFIRYKTTATTHRLFIVINSGKWGKDKTIVIGMVGCNKHYNVSIIIEPFSLTQVHFLPNNSFFSVLIRTPFSH